MKKYSAYISSIFLIMPAIAFAKTLSDVASVVITYMNQALLLLMGLSVVIFVWYIIKYFITPNDKRTEAAAYLMWSMIGFFVILSMWGIVNVLIATFDFGTSGPGSWANMSNLFPH